MRSTIQCEYTHTFVPPKCRRARQEKRTADIDVEIKDVGPDDAPVAIKSRDRLNEWSHLRWYGGRLWCETEREMQKKGDAKDALGFGYTGHLALDALQDLVARKSDNLLVVGKKVYAAIDEPVLVVVTFGFGRGTSLAIRSIESVMRSLPEKAFGFTEIGQAVREAVSVAAARDDHSSIATIREMHGFYRVLIPEAFTFSGLNYRVRLFQDRISELCSEIGERQIRINELEKQIAECRAQWDEGAHLNA